MKKNAWVSFVGTACLVAWGCSGGDGLNENVEYTDWGDDLPEAGNPAANCPVPDEAMEEDVSAPDHVIGDGTPESCTSAAVVAAVAQGGVITFDCGPDPVTIVMEETARIFNDTGPEIVIDGGSKVILSGANARRILYMNTCDPDLVWTTDHCNDQDHPRLTVQNLTFADADSRGETEYDGGGAVWVRGGRFKAINCRFFRNVCADTGPDVGGAGIRVFDQYQDQEVYVVHSTFGGAADFANACSNGGAVSSIGVSWTILNSVLSDNRAIGSGGNPAVDGPGGGSGGAIYNDGNTMTLSLCGADIERNEANAYGPAIFFVSNNHDGTINIEDSVIRDNVSHNGDAWEILPGISGHDDTTVNVDEDSIVE
ncbi:MAG: hypothetical protein M0R80_20030 [Proteobacteria bacterium]|jgi:hypothetical protein|nr:hypothetical protein [Pseudomonadota bacterium]